MTSCKWTTVKEVAYDGKYDGCNTDRRACGGIVLIQERRKGGKVERRAVTSNGPFHFVTPLEPASLVR
jgi:hypothetical protein